MTRTSTLMDWVPIILSSGDVFSVDGLWLPKETSRPASRFEASAPFKGEVEPRSEREIIEAALADTRGRVSGPSGAAAKLRIPPFLSAQRVSHRGACRQCPSDFRIAYKVVNIMMRASGNFFAIELVLQFLYVLERPP